VVEKGFIAIDGTSLTVCSVDHPSNSFEFMLVEYTQKKIVVPLKAVGEEVNIEVDVVGKYAEAALVAVLPRIEELEREVKELRARL
jgi:riboflavin synthase